MHFPVLLQMTFPQAQFFECVAFCADLNSSFMRKGAQWVSGHKAQHCMHMRICVCM